MNRKEDWVSTKEARTGATRCLLPGLLIQSWLTGWLSTRTIDIKICSRQLAVAVTKKNVPWKNKIRSTLPLPLLHIRLIRYFFSPWMFVCILSLPVCRLHPAVVPWVDWEPATAKPQRSATGNGNSNEENRRSPGFHQPAVSERSVKCDGGY